MRVQRAMLVVGCTCVLVLLMCWAQVATLFGSDACVPGMHREASPSSPPPSSLHHASPGHGYEPLPGAQYASLSLGIRANKAWWSTWWPGNATHGGDHARLTPPQPVSGRWMACGLRGDGFNNQLITLTECMEVLYRGRIGFIPGVFAEEVTWDHALISAMEGGRIGPFADYFDEEYARARFPLLPSHAVTNTCGTQWVSWGYAEHEVNPAAHYDARLVRGVLRFDVTPEQWLQEAPPPDAGPCFMRHRPMVDATPWSTLGRYKGASPAGYGYSPMWWSVWRLFRPSRPILDAVTALLSHPDSPLSGVPFLGVHVRRGDFHRAYSMNHSLACVAQHVTNVHLRGTVPVQRVYVASHAVGNSTVDDVVQRLQALLPSMQLWHAANADLQAWAGVTLRPQQYSVVEQLLLSVADVGLLNPHSSWSAHVARLRTHARFPTYFIPEGEYVEPNPDPIV